MANTRSTYIPYSPATPPTEVDRAIWDEFYKLQEALIALDKPASISANKSATFPVQATVVWNRLLANPTIVYEQPKEQLQTSGVWTCPQEGLYSIAVIIEIAEFPNAGNRLYKATLRTTLQPAIGGVPTQYLSAAGGPDEAPLRLVANFSRPLFQGDTLTFDLDLTEESFTGSVPTQTLLNITRQSSIR